MSEDAPQQATSEEGNQVPVRYEGSSFTQTDSEGNSLITGENIGPGSPLVGENYEHNSDKAHDMAAAGNSERTFASNARYDAQRKEDWRLSHDIGPGQEAYYDTDIQASNRRAERADARADKIELWAGILHDHPVSEEYEKSHPEIRFTPEGLALFEELLQYKKNDLADIDEQYFSDEHWGTLGLPERLQKYVRDKQESEIDPELANLLSSTDTTLGKLREYFMNLDKKQLESQVNEAQAVIDAIQGGKASEQTSPETPEN